MAAAQEAPAASSDPATLERARELFENGSVLYDEGHYREAIAAFEEGYRVSGKHTFLFNIANAYERLGELDMALKKLNEYRAFATADERDKLERRIINIEDRLKAERATRPPPQELKDPEPEPEPQPTASSQRGGNGLKWALLGTGLAVTAGFGTVSGVTYGRSRTFLDENDQQSWDDIRPLNNASVVLTGVGAALTVVGIAIPLKKGGKTASLRLGPSPTPDGLGFGFSLGGIR